MHSTLLLHAVIKLVKSITPPQLEHQLLTKANKAFSFLKWAIWNSGVFRNVCGMKNIKGD